MDGNNNLGGFDGGMPKTDGFLDGLNVKLNDIDILKNTDLGVLSNKGGHDKSKYTRTTKPDGTVIEEVKINKKKKNKGLLSLNTDGINFGKNAVVGGLSKDVSEDVGGVIGSIFGKTDASSKIQDKRMKKLEVFKEMKEKELANESEKRNEFEEEKGMSL